LNYPLQRPAPIFHAADLVMVNFEGALPDHARQVGLNRTPERFAISMRAAGIGLVNLANNHTFDADERGFLDTLRALSSAGIAHVGGGNDLADARKPVIVERNGIKLGSLGYTQFTPAYHNASRRAPSCPNLSAVDIQECPPRSGVAACNR
jgi:poly-gamma-glutamate capsule biosynthesis protein CapA/YwtB (metallophosphatase superfamily)